MSFRLIRPERLVGVLSYVVDNVDRLETYIANIGPGCDLEKGRNQLGVRDSTLLPRDTLDGEQCREGQIIVGGLRCVLSVENEHDAVEGITLIIDADLAKSEDRLSEYHRFVVDFEDGHQSVTSVLPGEITSVFAKLAENIRRLPPNLWEVVYNSTFASNLSSGTLSRQGLENDMNSRVVRRQLSIFHHASDGLKGEKLRLSIA